MHREIFSSISSFLSSTSQAELGLSYPDNIPLGFAQEVLAEASELSDACSG